MVCLNLIACRKGFWDTHFTEMIVWPKSRWANSCVDKIWLEGPSEIPTSVPNMNYIRAGLKQQRSGSMRGHCGSSIGMEQ